MCFDIDGLYASSAVLASVSLTSSANATTDHSPCQSPSNPENGSQRKYLKPIPEGFNVRNSTERGKRVRNEGHLYECCSPFGLNKQEQKKEGQKAKTSNGDNQDVLLDKKISY